MPWPPGGGADVLSRMLSPQLSETLKQQIVIDNRGGAAGNIGAEMAAKSPPDGYTIVFAYSGTHAINPSIYRKMPFKESDFAPIIQLASVPQVLVVHPSLPVKSVKDLVALAKKPPGRAYLRLERQRGVQPSHRGVIQHDDRHQARARARTRAAARRRWRCFRARSAMILGEPATIVRFREERQGAGARGHQREARSRYAGAADDRGSGRGRLRSDVVERHAGAGGHAAPTSSGGSTPSSTASSRTPDMRKRMLDNGYEPVGGVAGEDSAS